MSTFLQRMTRYREQCGISRDEMGKSLGVTGRYIGMIERGEKTVAEDSAISRLLALYEDQWKKKGVKEDATKYHTESRVPPGAQPVRWVPLISWVHAGEAASYEELPLDQQDVTPTLCRDTRAFALTVEGDSMMPKIEHGDQLIVMPSEEPRNGCIVVAKLRDDGVIVRRFSRLPNEKVKLIAYNTLYPSTEHSPKEFHWIYPVHSTVRREWN